MSDGFLQDYMVLSIDKEIAEKFIFDEIINMYDMLGSRRAKMKLIKM
jgi:hypothetical protein